MKNTNIEYFSTDRVPVVLEERTMGKVMQIDEHAPAVVKEALDSSDLSSNQGYNIIRQVRELPEKEREEAVTLAVELENSNRDGGQRKEYRSWTLAI